MVTLSPTSPMKRVSLSLAAVSMVAGPLMVMAQTTTTPTACQQAAIEKRETTIGAAFDVYAATVKATRVSFKESQKSAWVITDKKQRRTALKASEKAFKTSVRSAEKFAKDAERAAKKLYKTESKACPK